jgi:hypothetical protein
LFTEDANGRSVADPSIPHTSHVLVQVTPSAVMANVAFVAWKLQFASVYRVRL